MVLPLPRRKVKKGISSLKESYLIRLILRAGTKSGKIDKTCEYIDGGERCYSISRDPALKDEHGCLDI